MRPHMSPKARGGILIGVMPASADGYLYLFVQGRTPSAYNQLP
jgi:hypothetical protein